MYGLSGVTTIITVSYVGGLPFIFEALLLMVVQWSNQMRGSCRSLHCKFFSMFVGFNTDMVQPELPNVLHNLTFEINPGERLIWFIRLELELICNV
jgi:hypothetical protein